MKKIISFLTERKNFIMFSFLKIFTLVVTLGTNIFIIRELTVSDFGVFSVALMVVNLLNTIGFSWSSSSILYYGSREKEIYGSINKTFWARNIIIGISLAIVTIGFVVFRNQINQYIGLDIWYLLLLWLYVSVIENYLNQYFLAIKKQFLSGLLSLTLKLLYLILIIAMSFDVVTLVILYIVSHSSAIIFLLGINRDDIGAFELDKDWFKEVLNFSLWQLFGFSGLYIINFGDIAVIKYFMTDADVGIYNGAYQLFAGIISFSYVINGYYSPLVTTFFVKNDVVSVKQFFYKERLYILGAGLIGHLVVIALSGQIIITIYGEDYRSSILIFNILMIGSFLRYAAVFYTIYYNTNKKHKILQLVNIAQAVINILLTIVLVQFFGLAGAALGTILAILLSFLFSFYYCEKRIIKFISYK